MIKRVLMTLRSRLFVVVVADDNCGTDMSNYI